MKAALCTAFGGPDVIAIVEVPKPVPKPGEVLIRIRATTVSSGDWRVRSASMPRGFGLIARLIYGFGRPRKPLILGTELSGEVEAVGAGVAKFKPGDRVVAFPGAKFGAHAEYICFKETGAITLKPANLTFPQAAALSFGGATALQFLQKARLLPGETVLIIGASGAVGSAAVQLARHFGAEVTGIAGPANQALLVEIGAQHSIDYSVTDFATTGQTWDVIMDTTGTASLVRMREALAPNGRMLLVMTDLAGNLGALWNNLTSRQKAHAFPASERAKDLDTLAALARTGTFMPVIDCILPFSDIRAAHARTDSGHKRGSVVLELDP